jgi:hypothetical protein
VGSPIHFWDLLDTAPDACMPLSSWTERLGDSFPVLRRFLIRDGTLATYITDHSDAAVRHAIRSDGEKWWREKVQGQGLDIVDVDLLAKWRVDWAMLTAEIRVALDLSDIASARGRDVRFVRIGRVDVPEDSGVLVLSLATTPREQSACLFECAADPRVVAFLTVSGAAWCDEFVMQVKAHDIALACLSQVVELGLESCLPSGRWKAVRERVLATARLRRARQAASTNEFCRVHSDWLISFNGHRFPLAHKSGLLYLHELMSKQHQSLGALELLSTRDEHRAIDIRAIGRQEHVIANGKTRRERETPQFRSMKNSIKQDIERALEAIAKPCPALAMHFKDSLSYGSTFKYSPQPDVEWTL